MAEPLEPFVGPRPFEREDEKYFFGRDQAAIELVSLILANPHVILYAQSGAGKTSLLKAKVLSVLENKKGFDVLPIARVRSQGSNGDGAKAGNIYVANALRDLSDNTLSAEQRAQLTFAEYLSERPRPSRPPSELDEEEEDQDGQIRRVVHQPRVVIFDQFEELFTQYPERYNERKNFFEQLSDALEKDPLLRVVFSMREDYIAELDPYLHLLPDSMRTRSRLERLRKPAALQAVLKPLHLFNDEHPDKQLGFKPGVAEALVDNLRAIKIHSGEQEVEFEGEFIEPVHLQIVCKALWEKMLLEGKKEITEVELETFGNVNQALADYYERAITRAAKESGVSEGDLRRWVDEVLITPENTRSTVLRGRIMTSNISNTAIDILAAERLIRSETRDNREWYELSHDKLIEPIRASYQQWLLQSGDEQLRLRLIGIARKWLASRRTDDSLLLSQAEISTAEQWTSNDDLAALVEASKTALENIEREREQALALERERALEAEAQVATERAEAERLRAEQAKAFAAKQARAARVFRLLAAGLAVMMVLSIGVSVFAFQQRRRAIQQSQLADQRTQEATDALRKAKDQELLAEERRKEAVRLGQKAEDEAEAARLAKEDAEREKVRADEAADIAQQQREEARLQKTLAVSSTAAASAELMITQQPKDINSSVKRALASLALNSQSNEGEQALRHGMALMPRLLKTINFSAVDVSFTPNGEIAASNLAEASLFDTNGKLKNKTEDFDQEDTDLIMSDNGEYVALVGPSTVQIRNLTNPEQKIAPIIYKTSNSSSGADASDVPLLSVTFSPKGTLLAGALTNNRVLVWQTAPQKLMLDVTVKLGQFEEGPTLDISKNDEYIIIQTQPETTFYKLQDGKLLQTIPHKTSERDSTQILGTNYMAAASNDLSEGPAMQIMDLRTGKTLSHWLTASPVGKIVFSSDEKSVATSSGNTVTVWDTESGREISRVSHTVNINNFRFSPDGTLLATASQDKTARLWNARTGRELMRMGHDEDVNSISFSPDGKILATADDGEYVRLWDINRTGQGLELYQDGPVDQIVNSHNGAYLAVITYKLPLDPDVPPAQRPRNVTIFENNTGDQIFNESGRILLKAAFSNNDQSLFLVRPKSIEKWGWQGGKHKETAYDLDGLIYSVDISGDGRYAVASIIDKGVKLVDLSGKQPITLLPFKGLAMAQGKVAISFNGQRVFLQETKGKHSMWDMDSNTVTDLDEGYRTGVIKVSPDGRYLASTVPQPRVLNWKIYDTAKSRPVFEKETSEGLKNVAFSKDGKYLALTYRNQSQVEVCELETQTCTTGFFPESLSTLFAFSDDSNYFAAGGGGLVQIWSLGVSREVTRLEYSGTLRGLGFSSDNKYVVSGSTDRSVRLALLRISDLIDIACERTGGLSKEEWDDAELFKGEPYRKTCPAPK